jgi:hypothetical protein
MKTSDPLERLERGLRRMKDDPPPAVHVVPEVLRRVRQAEASSERALALFTVGACAFAVAVVFVGMSVLVEPPDPLGAFFQIVPPIEL